MSFFLSRSNTETAYSKRDVEKVPFVELHGGRLQGVVSSGSSVERVYIAFIKAGSHDFYCSTNNNRRCGGLTGTYCKHLVWLLTEAVKQYGATRVAEYLQVSDSDAAQDVQDIRSRLHGSEQDENVSEVFSRFLGYLVYLEQETSVGPVPEMAWFL